MSSLDFSRTIAEGCNVHWRGWVPGYETTTGAVLDALCGLADEAREASSISVRGEARSSLPWAALLHQTTNAALDLFLDCGAGRAASAQRAARTLIELVASLSAIQDAGMAQRYVEHETIAEQCEAEMTADLRRLSRKTAGAIRHRRKTILRDSADDVRDLIAKYTKSFRTSWSPRSTTQLINDAGLSDLRPYWSLASSTAHGAIAGTSMFSHGTLETVTLWHVGLGAWHNAGRAYAHALAALERVPLLVDWAPERGRRLAEAVEAAWALYPTIHDVCSRWVKLNMLRTEAIEAVYDVVVGTTEGYRLYRYDWDQDRGVLAKAPEEPDSLTALQDLLHAMSQRLVDGCAVWVGRVGLQTDGEWKPGGPMRRLVGDHLNAGLAAIRGLSQEEREYLGV